MVYIFEDKTRKNLQMNLIKMVKLRDITSIFLAQAAVRIIV